MFVEWLWTVLKAAVSAIWLPVLAVVSIWLIWKLTNLLIEQLAGNRSEICKKLNELYGEVRGLPVPTDIDLRKSIMTVMGKELPEEIFFVDYHEEIQKQLNQINDNRRRCEEIQAQKDAIRSEFEAEGTHSFLEGYVVRRYAKRIENTISHRPDAVQARLKVWSKDGPKEILYSFDEIVSFNNRYDELQKSLKEKRLHQYEIEEKERKQAELKQKEAAQQKASREKEEERRKEAIRQERSKLSASLRYDVLKRDNFRCTICGRSAADGVTLHVDHIKPVSKGGKTEMSNLRTLCDYCNLGKSDKYDPNGMN